MGGSSVGRACLSLILTGAVGSTALPRCVVVWRFLFRLARCPAHGGANRQLVPSLECCDVAWHVHQLRCHSEWWRCSLAIRKLWSRATVPCDKVRSVPAPRSGQRTLPGFGGVNNIIAVWAFADFERRLFRRRVVYLHVGRLHVLLLPAYISMRG